MAETSASSPLWAGRFEQPMDAAAWALNASLSVDRRLALVDVRVNQVWAEALEEAGVLSAAERAALVAGLETLRQEFQSGNFVFQPTDEDIHTAVERRLRELVGPLGGKIATGRSRNDLVATDLRLWLMEQLGALEGALLEVQKALLDQAEASGDLYLPGYTHLQRAQPVLLAHWWLAYFWPLERDRQRLGDLYPRIAVMPMGAAALAGSGFPIDREHLARRLGFLAVASNSLDAVADRDFAAEFLFVAAMLGIHLSQLAEMVILFCSQEFGFLEIPDAFATGSSLMPQKKNPDLFELTRAKAGTLLGHLTALLAVLKGLPLAYNKDLQEDKAQVFGAMDTLLSVLPVLAAAIRALRVRAERMQGAVSAELMATDLADYLVEQGLPFREAHAVVGQVVRLALARGQSLDALDQEALLAIHPLLDERALAILQPRHSLARRNLSGGSGPLAVRTQLHAARAALLQRVLPDSSENVREERTSRS
ncbi:argininosuccinate lyase [Thermanaerothrix daxensis]|uniref:Argininosuccinate lyase n=1 Tax=Thermanaerothrix daxensis TaxID=869279 RepID=A0A0P6YJH2_9CHLR|nr:argininosuccinate lyase [Thermanaerothrix daxensis]KPL82553.1 argininosuccinate lyase [Thermanaerothrix daxensis]